MRVVFAGTPVFSLSSLEALAAHPAVELVAAYTQPDRPAGRGKKLTPSPIKERALELNLPVIQPSNFSDDSAVDQLRSLKPDLMVVTAYGLLLPRTVLDIPTLGCVNVHASLLPRWRGAAPIQRAIEAGDEITGVTLMQMETGLDTGPMLTKSAVPIESADTGGSLHDKLSVIGGRLLSDSLDAIREGRLEAVDQNDDDSCYAPKLHKKEAKVDWCLPAAILARKVRAFNPWPMANTLLNGQPLRILEATVNQLTEDGLSEGMVAKVSKNDITVQTGEGQLLITEVQKAGSRPMRVSAFLNGVDLQPGVQLG